MNQTFSGSYDQEDVMFLLKRVEMTPTNIEEKERLIQSGKMHYSAMLSQEKIPAPDYMDLFYSALAQNEKRFSRDIASLTKAIAKSHRDNVVIVSLVRAGTPVGVLVHRGLKHLGINSTHYSISIIRDRGIDWVALDYIRARHKDSEIVFLDGWTGKGAITGELNCTIPEYNQSRGASLDPALAVVADLSGAASLAATSDDYLIPSAVLNSIVSGLTSRSVLSDKFVGEGDFHACVYYSEFEASDISRYFVDRLTPHLIGYLDSGDVLAASWPMSVRDSLKRVSSQFMADTMQEFVLTDRNRIKPGIGESTRSLLRRVPRLLFVRDPRSFHVQHLVLLAGQRNVDLKVDPNLPYQAAVLIESLGEQ